MTLPKFTPEEIAVQSLANAEGVFLSTISFIKSKGYDLAEWTKHVGDQYAESWDSLENNDVAKIAQSAALNWISCGAELVAFVGDESSAEAVFRWPSDENIEFYGVSKSDAHKINNVFIPIAKKVGVKFSWDSDGEQFTLRFSKSKQGR